MESHVRIEDKLAAKGLKRAHRLKNLGEILAAHTAILLASAAVVAFTDIVMDAEHLIKWHFLALLGLCAASAIFFQIVWEKDVSKSKGWEFYARLDQLGVTVIHRDARIEWDAYANYIEFDDYLQIEARDGSISFLPKTPELYELIEFTKDKIPPR